MFKSRPPGGAGRTTVAVCGRKRSTPAMSLSCSFAAGERQTILHRITTMRRRPRPKLTKALCGHFPGRASCPPFPPARFGQCCFSETHSTTRQENLSMCLPIAGSKTLKTAREWPQTLAAEAPGAPARRPGGMHDTEGHRGIHRWSLGGSFARWPRSVASPLRRPRQPTARLASLAPAG